MADSRQEMAAIEQSYKDYLDKSGIRQQIKEATIKLIENRPNEPMLFLAEFFDGLCKNEKSDRVQSAMQVLKLTDYTQPAFQTNLMIAYDILSAPKNPNSKKLAYNRSGLIGMVYTEIINEITNEIPKEIQELLQEKIGCRPNEMIPFDVFKYSINVAFVLNEFLKVSLNLFSTLKLKSIDSTAPKQLCQEVINLFKKSLKLSNESDPSSILNANRQLRPNAIAIRMLEVKDLQKDELTDEEEFIYEICECYLNNLKSLS